MKAKEYLLKHGRIDAITRGRLSLENTAFILEAVRNGEQIDGYSVSTGPVKGIEAPVIKKELVTNEKVIAEIPPYRFEESDFKAIEYTDGKKFERSLRSACILCKVSLVGHYCDEPRIVARDGRGDVRVYIERKKVTHG